jgi:hypothetical protein
LERVQDDDNDDGIVFNVAAFTIAPSQQVQSLKRDWYEHLPPLPDSSTDVFDEQVC